MKTFVTGKAVKDSKKKIMKEYMKENGYTKLPLSSLSHLELHLLEKLASK